MKRLPVLAVVVLIAFGALAVPAGASTHHKAKVAAPSKKKVGQAVITLLAEGNAHVDKDKAPGTPAAFSAVSEDFAITADELEQLKYPSDARSDAKELEKALNKLSYDASQISSDETNAMLTTIENDEGSEVADSDALRHDLGVPPAKV